MTVVANPQRRLALSEWQRWEQVGLSHTMELDELLLNWTDSRVRDLDARGALVSLRIERTIDGGSTVTMVLRDDRGLLFAGQRMREQETRRKHQGTPVDVDEGWEPVLHPDEIGRAMEVELDGVTFRLVKVRASSATREIELTFEDRIVYWLKRKHGVRRTSRAKVTRAEFILSLLREIKAARYRFVCPALHTRQPIDHASSTMLRRDLRSTMLIARSASSSSSSSGDDEQGGGFAPNAHVTVKGQRATPDQLRNLDGVLTECSARGCSREVMVATVCCVTQESVARRVRHGDNAGPDSLGLFQQRAPWGSSSARLDPARSTRMFLTGGNGGQPGWKQKHGSLQRVPGSIESAVKAVQVSVGGYGQWAAEARHTVSAWGGAGSAEGDAAVGGTYVRSYQFTRNAGESSWAAMQRLAGEVGWRLFVVGNSVYYMSEPDLYRRRARYAVTPTDDSVLDVAYDVDWGKPVSECTLSVVLDRWGAPPGAVVTLDGYGPADGRWLVTSVSRDYFSPVADVSLVQPGRAKLEPAHERVQRAADASSTASSSDAGINGKDAPTRAARLYRECKRISDAGGPYVYGGGHGAHLVSLSSGQGLDCSSSVSLALHRAGLFNSTDALTSGVIEQTWGEAGKGRTFTVWASPAHVWIQFHGLGNAWRFDTSPYGSGGRGPRLRFTPRPTTGFSARHWKGL
jgi:hypothetical protein